MDHLFLYDICFSNDFSLDSFTILKKCNSKFETKTHGALLIKKRDPKINKHGVSMGFIMFHFWEFFLDNYTEIHQLPHLE